MTINLERVRIYPMYIIVDNEYSSCNEYGEYTSTSYSWQKVEDEAEYISIKKTLSKIQKEDRNNKFKIIICKSYKSMAKNLLNKLKYNWRLHD